jgi:hypothetical protein
MLFEKEHPSHFYVSFEVAYFGKLRGRFLAVLNRAGADY